MQLSDAMHQQARALADPSRFTIFRHIASSERPVEVASLAELMGFHHTAIRQHVAVLVEAAMVVESDRTRTSPGRPRKQYAVRADALAAFASVSGSYERLARLLLQLATTSASAYEVGFADATGGADNGGGNAAAALAALTRQLASDGFQPRPGSEGVVVLGHCPFANLAAADSSVICELHRGLLDGEVASLLSSASVELTVKNPHRAGCRVTLIQAG